MQEKRHTDILKIRDAVARARENGMDLSEYTLRRAIRSGQLPCRIVGRTYLVSWQNLVNWVTCMDSCDNPVQSEDESVQFAK
ncbi:MAG: hypothetical protein Q4F17_08705 [Eubacteriales bacterium]|nr:hypothetical protein [Eubacteriales bacterium]